MKVDVIVTGVAGALRVLQQATATIPIVAAYSTDPVGNGLVASLAHPGGNITGLVSSSDDTSPKQLELLITVVPGTSRVGLLGNPNSPTYSAVFNGAQNAGRKVNLSIVPVEARNPEEIISIKLPANSGEKFTHSMITADAQNPLAPECD